MEKPNAAAKGAAEAIVPVGSQPVKSNGGTSTARGKRGRPKSRRQSHGSAWHWKQTDCWYYTLPGTKKRIPLLDDNGEKVRGKDNREKARLALARVKLAEAGEITPSPLASGDWIVAKVCSEYIQYCEKKFANGTMSRDYSAAVRYNLNDLCEYCGALSLAQLKKSHIREWVDRHPSWKSPATERSVVATVIAAFNYAQNNFDVPNPLKGLKRPASKPRLHSITDEDEKTLFGAVGLHFKEFLFAALHTGLRPFCELARMTADDVEETPRGMMWRVYSSKTKKTRKIPLRTEVAVLVRRLMKTAPKGTGTPLFRTMKGKAWSRVNGVQTFCSVRRKLGWDKDPVRKRYSSYSCRHTFAHRMLSGYWNNGAGCTVETLAELIGDTPKVAFEHYGREWGQHYQEPLWAAIGAGSKHGKR